MIHKNSYGIPYPQGTFDDPKTRVEEEGEPTCDKCGEEGAYNHVTVVHEEGDITLYYCDKCYEEA